MRRTTQITAVGSVGVPVTDQDQALEFYVGQLGFEKRRDLPFGDGRWIEVAPPGRRRPSRSFRRDPRRIRLPTPRTPAPTATPPAGEADVDPDVTRMEMRRPCSPCGLPTATASILVGGA